MPQLPNADFFNRLASSVVFAGAVEPDEQSAQVLDAVFHPIHTVLLARASRRWYPAFSHLGDQQVATQLLVLPGLAGSGVSAHWVVAS